MKIHDVKPQDIPGFGSKYADKTMKRHYHWGNLDCTLDKKPRDIAWFGSKCKQNYENALSLGKS
jgi:hypothetical protein